MIILKNAKKAAECMHAFFYNFIKGKDSFGQGKLKITVPHNPIKNNQISKSSL